VRRACVLFALTFSCLLSATTIVPTSVEELTRNSSHVVEALAAESWAQWDSQHRFIYTYTRFQISASLKGAAPANLVVRQLGGSAEGYTQKVAGVRGWAPGERAVLFLRPSMVTDGSFEVTGLMQGNFRIRVSSTGESLVSNGVQGVSSYETSSGGITNFRGNQMRLQELESRVRRAAGR
jgi:hypothetical protein